MQTTTTTVQGWGEALMTSLTTAFAIFFGAIPRIIAFALIVLVGWLVAKVIARGVAALLRALRFNELAERAGLADFVQKMGVRHDATTVLAAVTKWFVLLIAFTVAFDALGLPAVSSVLRQLLLWLPNLAVALVVLVVGGVLAAVLARLVRASAAEAGLGNPDLLATLARAAVWGFAIIVAVNQIGIAATLVNTLFTGLVAMIALGGGLAFGLGGRDVASRIWDDWYRRAGRGGRVRAHSQPQQPASQPRPARQWGETELMPAPMRADEPGPAGE